MTQKTMVIDLDRCIGCFACEVACKQENNVALGVYYNKVLSIGPMGKFPDIKQYFFAVNLPVLQGRSLRESLSNRSHLSYR